MHSLKVIMVTDRYAAVLPSLPLLETYYGGKNLWLVTDISFIQTLNFSVFEI